MTLPSLIQKQQFKVTQSQLKKAMSVHSQAILQTKNFFGISNFNSTFIFYDKENDIYPYRQQLLDEYKKYTKIVGKCTYKTKVRNYNNTNNAYVDIGGTAAPMYLAPDGSCFSIGLNASTIGITVDVNGAGKRPNQLGHDIFIFYVNNKDFLVPMKMTKDMTQEEVDALPGRADPDKEGGPTASEAGVEQRGWPCTRKNNQKGNGMGCAWYALQDVCPDDSSKKYWECLP